ncbi:amidohydrolase [Alicyclobacillus tolerans]|uniref:amidohydrolase family protein n=1 Tax=Alicyclobacillus tolerans TaxID=90970 RepID=UPI001F2A6774|nr:amidohydrolase family protein [Alicyclobacillus tolerans]MCF8563161.1 amidohydrolase [Alicyclobacillus tolerans]
MRQGYKVVDVDAHYLEPINEIANYVDEPWRTRIKSINPDRLIPMTLGDRMLEGRIRRDDMDYSYNMGVTRPNQVSTVMSRLGVDASILVANRLVTFGHTPVRDLVVALANGYIDFMLDQVASPDKGIYTMPIVPWQDPEESSNIIHRVAADPAVVGVCLMSSGAYPPLGDVRYDPIYRAAQDHDLPIVFHSAPGLTLVDGASPADGFQRLIEAHSFGFTASNLLQLTSVLMQGLPERFPKLRYVFQESGVFWIPMMMYRLDEYYLKRRSEAPLLKGLPSEYVLDRFYFGTQPLESPKNQHHLEAVFDMADGTKHFLFASDYPHFDYDDPSAILKLSFLSRENKADVLGNNAMKVFNLRKGGVKAWESTLQPRLMTSNPVKE